MAVLRHLCFSLFFFSYLGMHLAAEPPYMWYATYSVNNYSANGDCGRGNLQRSHEGAEAFSAALESMNLNNTWYRYKRKDSECLASRWTGESAEVNQVDFVFYAGHGCGKGPVFGCNPEYQIFNKDDIRFGGNYYLKWVQAASCSWFTPTQYDDCQTGLSAWVRWKPCFRGVHAIMGHMAKTWEYEYMQEAAQQFWNDWCVNGFSIWEAWYWSQAYWVYEKGGNYGLQIAIAAPTEAYAHETFADASDAPAPAPAGDPWIEMSIVGYPAY